MIITSTQNDKIKRIVRLRDKKGRDEEKTALIEGYRAISRAISANIKIIELFFCRDFFLGENEIPLINTAKSRGAKIFETTAQVFAKFAYRDRPEGLLATIPIKEHPLSQIKDSENATYLVLESIEKPGNLGSMLRSADATATNAVIICEKRTDIYNPNVITASTGAIFTVQIAEDSSENVFAWLKKNNVKIIATSPHAKKKYTDENMTKKIAIILGSEQCGLNKFWLERSDTTVSIPMLGMTDSLNVSVSATLLLYEAARQKKWKTLKKTQETYE